MAHQCGGAKMGQEKSLPAVAHSYSSCTVGQEYNRHSHQSRSNHHNNSNNSSHHHHQLRYSNSGGNNCHQQQQQQQQQQLQQQQHRSSLASNSSNSSSGSCETNCSTATNSSRSSSNVTTSKLALTSGVGCSSSSTSSRSTKSTSVSSSYKSVDRQTKYLNEHLYIKSYLDIEEEDRNAKQSFKAAPAGGIRNYTPKILSEKTNKKEVDVWI